MVQKGIYLIWAVLVVFEPDLSAQYFTMNDSVVLYQAGEDGYDTYRIPAIVKTINGVLLAFCEGRVDGGGDSGDIDLVMKRSTDLGQTWSDLEVLWDDGANTCGNPCPVVDRITGDVFLLLTHNLGHDHEGDIIRKTADSTRTVWVMKSENDGLSWAKPREITSTAKDRSWGWYATGPGNGIQIRHGPRKGWLVIPCDHSYDDENGNVRGGPFEYGSHTIYSHDHGQTWKLGGVIRPKVNECTIVETATKEGGNGTLLMNMRSYFGNHLRTQAVSYDGGMSWTNPTPSDDLVEPVCQASMIRLSWPGNDRPGELLFSNPASSAIRHNISIRISRDEGKTWPYIQTLYTGPSAYSSMVRMNDHHIGILYEAGIDNPYEQIIFHSLKRRTKK